jgi:hypothetical protein
MTIVSARQRDLLSDLFFEKSCPTTPRTLAENAASRALITSSPSSLQDLTLLDEISHAPQSETLST